MSDGNTSTDDVEPLSWTGVAVIIVIITAVLGGGYTAVSAMVFTDDNEVPTGENESIPGAPPARQLALQSQGPDADSVTGTMLIRKQTPTSETRLTTRVQAKPTIGSKQTITSISGNIGLNESDLIYDTGGEIRIYRNDFLGVQRVSPDVSGSPLVAGMDVIGGTQLSELYRGSNQSVTGVDRVAGRAVYVLELNITDRDDYVDATVYIDQTTKYPVRYDTVTETSNGEVTRSVRFTDITYNVGVTTDDVTHNPPRDVSFEQIRESDKDEYTYTSFETFRRAAPFPTPRPAMPAGYKFNDVYVKTHDTGVSASVSYTNADGREYTYGVSTLPSGAFPENDTVTLTGGVTGYVQKLDTGELFVGWEGSNAQYFVTAGNREDAIAAASSIASKTQ